MNKNIINFIKKAKALPVLNSNITSISKIPLLCTCPFLSKGKREKRTKMQSILLGLKKGWETPTLPDNLLKLQLHPFIRIIRFLGGSSFLLILSKNYLNYNVYALYICMFFATIFTIYHLFLTFYRIKHAVKLFKDKDLDVRNSPLDRLAVLAAKALVCFKNGCDAAQPVVLTLGLLLNTALLSKVFNSSNSSSNSDNKFFISDTLSNANSDSLNNTFSDLNLKFFYEYLNSLNLIEISALYHIVVLSVIILLLINILSAVLGNEIIKFLKIEESFPKLTGFLRLRLKFQKYYLTLNFSLIFLLVIASISIDLLVLI